VVRGDELVTLDLHGYKHVKIFVSGGLDEP
jgi:nicotinic acid phosphoribosyltransferase